MKKTEEHFTRRCEISIIELTNTVGKKFKVTKRVPDMCVSETKIFRSKKKAKKQFDDWLK